MDEAQLRVAGPDDAPALVDLGARTFRDTYRGLMPDEPLEAYVAGTFTPRRIRDELRDPRNVHFLAELDGVAIGYAKLRDGPGPVATAAPIELERIYVDRSATGGGVGRRLLEAALRTAAAMGRETMWLGVWDRNEPARAFYARMGFTEVGAQAFEIGGLVQRDLILARPVGPGLAPGP